VVHAFRYFKFVKFLHIFKIFHSILCAGALRGAGVPRGRDLPREYPGWPPERAASLRYGDVLLKTFLRKVLGCKIQNKNLVPLDPSVGLPGQCKLIGGLKNVECCPDFIKTLKMCSNSVL
jgi:hypothetical protein